jgi:cell division septum initiation protein DivIVA
MYDIFNRLSTVGKLRKENKELKIQVAALIKDVGTTAKGEAMPNTPTEWYNLAQRYEDSLFRCQRENSELRSRINRLMQQIDGLKQMLEVYDAQKNQI